MGWGWDVVFHLAANGSLDQSYFLKPNNSERIILKITFYQAISFYYWLMTGMIASKQQYAWMFHRCRCVVAT